MVSVVPLDSTQTRLDSAFVAANLDSPTGSTPLLRQPHPPLLSACGFEPEDNGETLALRDGTGKKWTKIPEERLNQLKLALAEVEAQRRGLEHPEVADVRAVSAAVARLKDTRGQAAGWATAIGAILKYVENILDDNHMYLDLKKQQLAENLGEDTRKPKKDAKKHRFINMGNAVFTRQVASQPGAVELMVALGFRESEGGLLLPNEVRLLVGRRRLS